MTAQLDPFVICYSCKRHVGPKGKDCPTCGVALHPDSRGITEKQWAKEQGKLRNNKLHGQILTDESHSLRRWLDSRPSTIEWFQKRLQATGIDWPDDSRTIDTGWTVLGGYGWAPKPPARAVSGVIDDGFALAFDDIELHAFYLPWDQLNEIEISGPGSVSTGGGWSGGGFGLGAAIQGILIAETLNALTTQEHTITLLYISGQNGGIALHTSNYEPESLRIRLSAGFGRLAESKTSPTTNAGTDPVDRLERLDAARSNGLLSRDEYEAARAKVINELTSEG